MSHFNKNRCNTHDILNLCPRCKDYVKEESKEQKEHLKEVVEKKTCRKCNETKKIQEFNKNVTKKWL